MKKSFTIVFVFLLLYLFVGMTNNLYAATLSISPSSKNVSMGDTFTISITLDTSNQPIDGVDVYVLTFNPSVLQVLDSDSSTNGIQIQAGSLMPNTYSNIVDNSMGKIIFSQVVSAGNSFSGSGTLATITFKAIASGKSDILFNYSFGNTTDSNIAGRGSDLLSGVNQGLVTVVSNFTSNTNITTNNNYNNSSNSNNTTNNQTPIATSLTRNLYRSMSGSDVVLLQKFLIEKGYLTPGNDSGFFGLQTEWAVKQYQSKRGIASYGTGDTTGYGVVGLKTRQAINNSLPNTSVQTTTSSSSSSLSSGSSNFYRDLTLGSQGQDVLALQVFLNNHGFSVAWSGAGSAGQETNYFGNATKAALAKYQSSVGIRPASGNFGPITRAYIGNFAQ